MKASQVSRGEASLKCTADQAALAQSLPLAPHSRVVVPITVHAPKVRLSHLDIPTCRAHIMACCCWLNEGPAFSPGISPQLRRSSYHCARSQGITLTLHCCDGNHHASLFTACLPAMLWPLSLCMLPRYHIPLQCW